MEGGSPVILAIKHGVYRHEILGAFDSTDEAIATGREFVTNEHDHYHMVEVVRVSIGESEVTLGFVEPDWEYIAQKRPNNSVCWSSHVKHFRGTKWSPVPGETDV